MVMGEEMGSKLGLAKCIIVQLLVGVCLVVLMLPYAGQPGPYVPGLTGLCAGTIFLADAVTSYLLFASFSSERSWGTLVLACAYFYSSLMSIFYLVTFPAALVPKVALIGDVAVVGLWPYGMWIGGYSLLMVAAGVVGLVDRGRAAKPAQVGGAIWLGVGATLATAIGLSLFILTQAGRLPATLVHGHISRFAIVVGCGFDVMLLISIVLALVNVRRIEGPLIWVSVAASWMLVSNSLAMIADGRYTIGWAVSRLSATVSATVLLIFFVSRLGLRHRWLKSREDFLEATVAARTAELVVEIGRRQEKNDALVATVAALRAKEAALLENEARLDRAQEIAALGNWELSPATKRYVWSSRLYRTRGVTCDGFEPTMGSVRRFVHPDDLKSFTDWQEMLLSGAVVSSLDIRLRRADGEIRHVRLEGQALRDGARQVSHVVGTEQDVTERVLLERRLVQSQKMDAIGTLTGGIAHDFNNHLTVIMSNVELACAESEGNATALEALGDVMSAAVMSAELISRLLAFARDQPLTLKRTDVNALVEHCSRLLRPILRENVVVTTNLGAGVWPVVIDPVQMESALVNLCTNGRDAMPKGGEIEISTRNILVTPTGGRAEPDLPPGAYVMIAVRDTGTGIPPHVIGRIFDPFFTTKAPGKGTGLGLSSAFGFSRQSGGTLAVQSELGRGTTVMMYLPRAEVGGPATEAQMRVGAQRSGGRRILLVDDNDSVRGAIGKQLAALGHVVLEAADGAQALRMVAADDGIELLLTDTVMPGELNGEELAVEVRRLSPLMPVIVMSGFAHAGRQTPVAGAGVVRVKKPFTRHLLASTIEACFAAAGPLEPAQRASASVSAPGV